MTPYDEALTLGLALGCVLSGMVFFALWTARDRLQGPLNPNPDWPDASLKPLTDEDLRLLRACRDCRRYLGPRRYIEAGQHLNIISELCPHCAKRAALLAK